MSSDEVMPTKRVPGLISRALGPFADALGLELAKLPAAATHNIMRLGEVFSRKAGEPENPSISPRLFRQIMDEAAWSEEEIVAEYLGGVLASSSKGIVSDRGVSITALIRRLSSLELRAHYVMYAELLRLGSPIGVCDLRYRSNMIRLHCELNLDEFMNSLDFSEFDATTSRQLLDHVILGLARILHDDPIGGLSAV